jgi:hypothetical protein
MQKLGIVIFLSVIAFASCKKDDKRDCSPVTIAAPSSEVETLRLILHRTVLLQRKTQGLFLYN